MSQSEVDVAAASALADQVTRTRKEEYLKSLLEDAFRDEVVRPLLERQGLEFVRDTCGTDEEGKDCVCIGKDSLNRRMIYAIQTKRGDLKMSSKLSDNVASALAQVQTALEADIYLTATKEKVKPDCVILCASGSINQAARRHVHDNARDPRIDFLDVNDLIPKIDKLYPEFWYGIDAQRFPYYRRLRQHLLTLSDTVVFADTDSSSSSSPLTDDAYVTLFAYRILEKIHKSHGEVERRPKMDQIPVQKILERNEKCVWITGEGGSGKTTALRRIAYEVAGRALESTKSDKVPVLLKANELSGDSSLAIAAGNATARLTPNESPSFSSDDLRDGKVVVLIDALDEIASSDLRDIALGKVVEFHQAYPACHILLTSRDYTSIQRMSDIRSFTRYTIESLDMRQAAKIVDRAAAGKAIAKEVAIETLRTRVRSPITLFAADEASG